MALTRPFQRIEESLTASQANDITTVINEVGDTVWIDFIVEIATVQRTIARIVHPLTLVNQLKVDDEYQEGLQLAGFTMYKFSGTAAAYVAGTAPTLDEGTKILENAGNPATILNLDEYYLSAGVARTA